MVKVTDAFRLGSAALVVAMLTAAPANAKSIYFYKAGVDRDTYVREYMECDALAGGVRVKPTSIYSNNIYSSAAGAFFSGFFASRERRALIENVLRTCMADKGYRRVAASDPVRKELGKLDEHARVDRLFELAAASTPEGEVLPR